MYYILKIYVNYFQKKKISDFDLKKVLIFISFPLSRWFTFTNVLVACKAKAITGAFKRDVTK